MGVNLYINDISLHGQFTKGLSNAVCEFLRTISDILHSFNDVTLWNNSRLLQAVVDANGHRLDIIQQENKNLWFHLIGVLDKAKTLSHSPTGVYTCNGNDVTLSSLSAAYDDQTARGNVIVVSLSPSEYSNNPLSVAKDGSSTNIRNIVNSVQIATVASGFAIKNVYDKTSQDKVLDEQTVLIDTELFELTNLKPQKGSKVYKRKGHEEYWYVDSAHRDGEAHLEVFATSNNFLGTCAIDDVNKFRPNTNKKKNGRKMIL